MKRLNHAARARAANRLAHGSTLMWHRRTAALARWVRRGRRDDLTGWKAALGPLARLVFLGALAWAAYRAARAAPWLLGVLVSLWCAASWRAGRTPTEDTAAAPEPLDPEAVRTLLLTLMGEASAVHLRTVLAHLQQQGHGQGWTVADLRARLEALGIPVRPKVKAPGGGPTRGVHRDDLAPSPPAEPETSTDASTAV
ncbi:hypothetical protein [Streptomyces sp. NBC_00483]|uniref:hypothetical protein n=1 Tax=Streptomyces sp. NBC_00483 TaxID=2975756 RepID=UPI002E184243